ncbi:transposase [Sphingobacteriaceae bacterium WQ 2009]|uniref:Transposase n=1 Tax=Rhinopithecimicrobium faecis TaxID=2820698 RepID=A0A8T4HB67_9SPHI|nr:transposase [Sphingobacteriaceae bacterium WQ 2009]
MKKIVFSLALSGVLLGACQQKGQDTDAVQKETIQVHDEIMPLISSFDQKTIRIDSLLVNLASLKQEDPALDTSKYGQDLRKLKMNLEAATDSMMEWMQAYSADSLEVTYQNQELVKIKAMKATFEKVQAEADSTLK